ncbi:MAG: hypothetical protein M2R45_01746 [Verrucomicrobia subdivision 3 bacterium]|nr:hypothetical protein [Limisphaerales bacterium]MCS1413483.1 hypothetical protein [Limisphaerales bacterium]
MTRHPKQGGFENVLDCANSREVLDILKKQPVDLIILLNIIKRAGSVRSIKGAFGRLCNVCWQRPKTAKTTFRTLGRRTDEGY